MSKNPILALSLNEVMRPEIAMPLQQVLRIYTVGGFLIAWRDRKNHKSIEQIFDTPAQAHHAATVCAAWLGVQSNATKAVGQWWVADRKSPAFAVPETSAYEV